MAGGTFVTRNKVRAGAYINFVSEYSPLGTVSDRGVVLLPMAVPFGPVGEAVAIEGDTDVRKVFGLSSLSPELLLLREAAKRANKVLVWRLAGGEAATRTDENITVTARWPGSVGNTLAVKILAPESGWSIPSRPSSTAEWSMNSRPRQSNSSLTTTGCSLPEPVS